MLQITYKTSKREVVRLVSPTQFPFKQVLRLVNLGTIVTINSLVNPNNNHVNQLASDDTVDLTDLIQSKSALIYGSYCDPKDLWPKP